MDDKLSIRVNIADRYYPLKVERKDEERIRKAAKLINEKLQQYKQRYTEKDMHDFLAMASLQFVTRVLEMEEKQDTAKLVSDIKQLNSELETFVADNNE